MNSLAGGPYRNIPEEPQEVKTEEIKPTLKEGMEDVYDGVMERVDAVRAGLIELTGLPAFGRFIFGQGSYRHAQTISRGERRELRREKEKEGSKFPLE